MRFVQTYASGGAPLSVPGCRRCHCLSESTIPVSQRFWFLRLFASALGLEAPPQKRNGLSQHSPSWCDSSFACGQHATKMNCLVPFKAALNSLKLWFWGGFQAVDIWAYCFG